MLKFLIQGHEHPRSPIRLKYDPRMRFEGVDDRLPPERTSPLDHGAHDGPVPDMEPVEVPDRQDRVDEAAIECGRPVYHLQC